MKRSELERISRGVDEDNVLSVGTDSNGGSASPQSKSSGGDGSKLLSPTSIVAPPEIKAAIFSIPRSEVCFKKH